MQGHPTVFCLIFQNKLRGQIIATAYLLYGFKKDWTAIPITEHLEMIGCSCSGLDQTKKNTSERCSWSKCYVKSLYQHVLWIDVGLYQHHVCVDDEKQDIRSIFFTSPATALTVSSALCKMHLCEVTDGKDGKKNSLRDIKKTVLSKKTWATQSFLFTAVWSLLALPLVERRALRSSWATTQS